MGPRQSELSARTSCLSPESAVAGIRGHPRGNWPPAFPLRDLRILWAGRLARDFAADAQPRPAVRIQHDTRRYPGLSDYLIEPWSPRRRSGRPRLDFPADGAALRPKSVAQELQPSLRVRL